MNITDNSAENNGSVLRHEAGLDLFRINVYRSDPHQSHFEFSIGANYGSPQAIVFNRMLSVYNYDALYYFHRPDPQLLGSHVSCTLYLLGAVIRRLQPHLPAGLCLITAALTAMGLGYASILTAEKSFSSGFTQGYGGFWITIMVAALFLGIYRLQVGERCGRVLKWLSAGVFEGYILSRLLDVWVYDLIPQWHPQKKYPLIFICITLPVFVISLLAGKCLHTLNVTIAKSICSKKTASAAKP